MVSVSNSSYLIEFEMVDSDSLSLSLYSSFLKRLYFSFLLENSNLLILYIYSVWTIEKNWVQNRFINKA